MASGAALRHGKLACLFRRESKRRVVSAAAGAVGQRVRPCLTSYGSQLALRGHILLSAGLYV